MKRFGVFICPHCGDAFSRETKTKRSKCPRCEKGIDIQKLLIIYQTDNAMAAAEGVRQVNLKNLAGEKAKDISAFINERMKEKGPNTDARPKELVLLLDCLEKLGEADTDGLHRCIKTLSKEEIEILIQRAGEEGMLFETRTGYYRLV